MTQRESIEEAEAWMQELRDIAPEQCIVALAGNKLDKNQHREVQMGDGQGFARKHKIKIISEVSAMNGENVGELV